MILDRLAGVDGRSTQVSRRNPGQRRHELEQEARCSNGLALQGRERKSRRRWRGVLVGGQGDVPDIKEWIRADRVAPGAGVVDYIPPDRVATAGVSAPVEVSVYGMGKKPAMTVNAERGSVRHNSGQGRDWPKRFLSAAWPRRHR